MDTSNLIPFNDSIRIYTIVKMDGKTSLACWCTDHWEVDRTCRSINELLHSGLVGADAVRGWVAKQGSVCVD